jgi:hypothetical protein
MIKHTAAPWHQGGYEVQDDKGALICNLSGWRGEQQTLANARLIAAAPDLLEALKAMLRSYEFLKPPHSPMSDAQKKAQAAITKAEGSK